MWNHFWHENGMYLRLLNLSMLTMNKGYLLKFLPTKIYLFLMNEAVLTLKKEPSKIISYEKWNFIVKTLFVEPLLTQSRTLDPFFSFIIFHRAGSTMVGIDFSIIMTAYQNIFSIGIPLCKEWFFIFCQIKKLIRKFPSFHSFQFWGFWVFLLSVWILASCFLVLRHI